MPIRVNCPNCGKQFSAWDDLIGKPVQCPKCQHKTVLQGANEALESKSKPTSSPAARPASQTPKPTPASASPKPVGSKPIAPKPVASPARPGENQKPPSIPIAAKPRPTPSPPPADLDDDDDALPNGCPNCNATMAPNDDLCDHCGYHLILKKVIDTADMPKRNTATGFERVLQSQLSDSETPGNTMLWIKVFGCFAFLGFCWLVLGAWWWVGVVVFAGFAAFVWKKQRQRAAETGEGEVAVNQEPISAAIWSLTLGIQRLIGWRDLKPPFAKVRALKLCDPEFDDRELKDLNALSELEALDLEGTGLTNAALDTLKQQKQLRFLVVRRTKITPSAVQRLQVDLPRLLIWI